jgi:ABC-type glycerol-3-phosphate transport system permease component
MKPTALASSSRSRLALAAEGLLLLAGAAFLLLPYLWMLSTAVKSPSETFRLPLTLIPDTVHWETFPRALTHFAFPTYILNSLIVASAVTVSSVVLASMAGYALTRFHFRGRELLFLFMLTTLMLPTEVVLVPQFLVVHALGWLNTFQGLIVPTALDAFAIFLMRQFMLSFPKELIDAARVDGAGEFTIYSRIVLPNLKPAIAAIAVFSFRDSWDQFIWPLVIISRDAMKTFPIGVAQLESEAVGVFNEQMAIAAIGMIPMVLLFALAQKAFVQGIAMTGLKGE